MTLNELLKVVDDNTRIQIRLKMFGSTFSTNRYKNYLLNDEKEAKLLLYGNELLFYLNRYLKSPCTPRAF